MYDLNETQEVTSTQWQEKQMQTFTAKKGTSFFFHVFFPRSTLVLCCSLFWRLYRNIKMVSHKDNEQALQELNRHVPWGWRHYEERNKKTKEEAEDNNERTSVTPTLNVFSLPHSPAKKIKHQILGIHMRYWIARNNESKLFTDGHCCFLSSQQQCLCATCLHQDWENN